MLEKAPALYKTWRPILEATGQEHLLESLDEKGVIVYLPVELIS